MTPYCNILSYVRWRGDLSFASHPFTLIDNLVFCKLAYYDLSTVPEAATHEGLALTACAERLEKDPSLEALPAQDVEFFRTCAASRRFGSVIIRHYFDLGTAESNTQICAMEFMLTDSLSYIAFRGTDSSLVGWREDFEISYCENPAQLHARSYLERHLGKGRTYHVGGHSKGANLALYATALTDKTLGSWVGRIFLNDGPGICHEVVSCAFSHEYRNKVCRILPDASIFGRLFEPAELPKLIVRSSEKGLFAHELLTWEITDGSLALVTEHTRTSEIAADAFAEWMQNVSPAEREQFVEELFSALGAGGTERVDDLYKQGVDSFGKVLRKIVSRRGAAGRVLARLPLGTLLGNVLTKLSGVRAIRWLVSSSLAHNLELSSLGVAFLFAQDDAMAALTSALFLASATAFAAEAITRAGNRTADRRKESWRVLVAGAAVAVFVLAQAKDDALFVLGSILMTMVLVAMSLNFSRRANTRPRNRGLALMERTISMLMAIGAAYMLVVPAERMPAFAVALGTLFVFAGALGALTCHGDRAVQEA